MLQFVPVQDANVFAVRVTGKLTRDDYEAFLPELEARITDNGKVSLLLEFEGFRGWSLDGVVDEVRFGVMHQAHFEKIAFVGDTLWQHWMALMAKPFVGGQIRYFSRDDLAQAWDWLRADQRQDEAVDTSISSYTRLVAAVDFSPHSIHAARRAADLAQRFGAELVLLNVINEEYLYDILYGPADIGYGRFDVMENPQDTENAMRTDAEQRMQALLVELADASVKTEIVVGTPAQAIVSFAEAHAADLVVIGTHGRRGVARLLGSNASSVAAKARCEVLIVPLQAPR